MVNPERTRSSVLIVQPYVPEYRVPLFQLMYDHLHRAGFDLVVAAGHPHGDQAYRKDAISEAPWLAPLRQTVVKVGRRKAFFKNLSFVMQQHKPNLIVLEQAIRNLETYRFLLAPAPSNKRKIAFWGQGRTYTESDSWLRDSMKRLLTVQADWFFAYTERGALSVQEQGFPGERVTTLRNATDTRQLREDLRGVTDQDIERFEERHHLVPGRSALFLGGLDDRKGLPFLLEAADCAVKLEPSFRLLIAGEGAQTDYVKQAQREGTPVTYLGRLTGHDKAVALRTAKVLAIPEWVGLVAVDSLAAAVPIVTTNSKRHAPEFEYLRNGFNALVVQHDPEVYGATLVRLIRDAAERKVLEAGCVRGAQGLSVEGMASRFVMGIESWHQTPKRRILSQSW